MKQLQLNLNLKITNALIECRSQELGNICESEILFRTTDSLYLIKAGEMSD